jgi:hypothetical protein
MSRLKNSLLLISFFKTEFTTYTRAFQSMACEPVATHKSAKIPEVKTFLFRVFSY